MKTIRVIPRIDVKGSNVVKGIHLEGLRVLGTPNSFAEYYYSQGADELIYMDIVASLYGRNSLLDVVRKTAEDVFIPITVGGGLRSIDDISDALKSYNEYSKTDVNQTKSKLYLKHGLSYLIGDINLNKE